MSSTSFEHLVRPYIPVVAHTKQKQRVVTVERPAVGIRWGNPSRFGYDLKDSGEDDVDDPTISYLHDDVLISGDEVYREWEMVEAKTLPEPITGNILVGKFERIKEVYFFVGETVEETESINDNGNIQPEITTTFHYVKLMFPMNNPDESAVESGTRGEHPDVTLEHTIATQTPQGQKIKEYWEGVFQEIENTFGLASSPFRSS